MGSVKLNRVNFGGKLWTRDKMCSSSSSVLGSNFPVILYKRLVNVGLVGWELVDEMDRLVVCGIVGVLRASPSGVTRSKLG